MWDRFEKVLSRKLLLADFTYPLTSALFTWFAHRVHLAAGCGMTLPADYSYDGAVSVSAVEVFADAMVRTVFARELPRIDSG